MNHREILLTITLSLTLHNAISIPEWNFLSYMQADNSLCAFTEGNINDMKAVGSTPDLNILAQLDVPQDRITHRLRLQKGSDDDNSDPAHEMGYHPKEEIIASIRDWVYKIYPANRLCLNLWSHGGGAVDRSAISTIKSNYALPKNNSLRMGLFKKKSPSRGILYDDSQGSYLSTVDIGAACTQIKTIIGHKIDILGMDACLMAMIEDAYEVRDSVEYLVASEQTIPGTGWPYDTILRALADNPLIPNRAFASTIVDAYATLYTKKRNVNFTLSAIEVTRVTLAVETFNILLDAIRAALRVNATGTARAFIAARNNTLVIDHDYSYVDLVDFYDNIIAQVSRQSRFSCFRKKLTPTAAAVVAAAEAAKDAALTAITHSAAGPSYRGRAHGMSIYFPTNGRSAKLYQNTQFAKDTSWPTLLATIAANA